MAIRGKAKQRKPPQPPRAERLDKASSADYPLALNLPVDRNFHFEILAAKATTPCPTHQYTGISFLNFEHQLLLHETAFVVKFWPILLALFPVALQAIGSASCALPRATTRSCPLRSTQQKQPAHQMALR